MTIHYVINSATKMRTLAIAFFACWLTSFNAGAQINVVSGGVGLAASYPTLTGAGGLFSALNTNNQAGQAIVISIVGDVVTEDGLTPLTGAAGMWTSLNITPSGARTISGSFAGNLIDLSGADNVTIDGLNTGGNSLIIDNTLFNPLSTTFRFINDAVNNTITNCTIKGSCRGTTNGTIFFSTGTTTGNDGNIISNNTITNSAAAPTYFAIYSNGTSAAIDNSGITINNNNIQDYYFDGGGTGEGAINLTATGNSAWTISNNRIFQTVTRNYAVAGTHNIINILGGNNYNISGNIIGFANASGTGTWTITGAVATRLIAINLAVGTTTATSVQGNTIGGISMATTSGAATTNGVLCGINITTGNVNIGTTSANTIGAATGTGSLVATPTTTQGAVVGINCSSTGTIVIQNNIIGALTSTGTTAAVAGAVFGINVSGIATSMTITGNTIGNSTADNMRAGTLALTTGSSIASGINASSTATTLVVTNNTIQNFASYGTGASGFVKGFNTTTSGTTTAATITGNIISNLTTNNTLTGYTSGLLSATGIHFAAGLNGLVSQNTISNISNTNTTATTNIVVGGISCASATNTTVSRNSICNLSNLTIGTTATAGPVVVGVLVRSGTTAINLHNNMISLGASQTSNTSFIGIMLNHGSTPDPTNNIYYNTVSISGTVTSGALLTSCLNRGDLTATSRNQVSNIRNNIFTNTRTGGTGAHYAISNNPLATSSVTGWTSNFNVLNGNASTIGYWTTAQTFAGWKTASASDANSLSGAPLSFVSGCDLHLNFGLTPTQVESGGTPIAGLTTDFDNQVRPGPAGSVNGGAFAPDFGADEFDGVYADLTAPTIVYTPLDNACSPGSRTLTATITDASGVPTAGAGLPVLYWKINAGAYTPSTGSFIGSNQYQFNLGSGTVLSDIVSYYIAAQDMAGTPNVTTLPLAGAGGFTSNPPAAATPPTTPSSYTIISPLSGTYNVGIGQTYTTLTAAVADYNSKCLTGPVTFILTDANYSGSETFPIILNANAGASSTNTLTIKPATTATISGSVASNSLIRLSGADYVIIDGSNSGGTDRSLTITNTSTTAPTAVSLVSLGTALGATNNVIKNCNLSTGLYAGACYGIAIGGSTPGTAGSDNDNATLQNNAITIATFGIYAVGNAAVSATGMDNLTVTGNSITTNTTVATYAMQLGGSLNSSISQNTISVNTTAATAPVGISLETNFVSSSVTRNNITSVNTTNTGGYGGRGIAIGTGTATSSVTIANNFISGVNGPSWTGFSNSAAMGIAIGMVGNSTTVTTIAGGLNIYYNSVNMYGSHSNGGFAGAAVTAAIYVGSAATNLDIRNNIFVNTQNNPNVSGTASKNYALYSAAANTAFTSINYNDYYVSGVQGVMGFIGSDRTNLAGMVAGFGGNANSQNIAPVFTSSSDLHLPPGSNGTLDNLGTFIASVLNDYDNDTRNVSTPDLGADEFSVSNCVSAAGGTITPSSVNKCVGQTYIMTAVGADIGTGITYQWEISPTGGGVGFVNVTGGSGANTTSYTTAPFTAGIYYYRLHVNCSFGPVDGYSNELVVTVNTLPTITVTPTPANALICGTGSVSMTASGGVSYVWTPTTFLAPAAGTSATEVSSATTTTIYSVTGTDANGCSNTANQTVTFAAAVTMSSVNAAPSSVCSGGSTTLTANATLPAPAGYCTASSTSTSFEKIGNVNVNTLNNTSTATAGYEDFTSITAPLTANIAYPCSVTVTGAYGDLSGGDDRVFIWIDMNQNGVFADPAERVYSQAISSYCACAGVTTTVFANLTVPNTATNGITRMRIRLEDQLTLPNQTPCGTTTYGQVEDYLVNITGGVNALSYLWNESPANGTLTSTTNNPTSATGITVGETYSVVATSAAGCTASGSTSVTVNTAPVIGACPSNITQCASGATAVTFTTPTATGTPAPLVTCSPASGSSFAIGTTLVTCTATNSCGSSSCSFSVTLNQNPTVTGTATDETCPGANDGTINTSITGGTGPYNCVWTGPTMAVTVVVKTAAHPYFGTGSGLGFTIDGVEGKEITLVRGVTYSFAINNPGHPFYISTDAVGAGAGEVLTGVTGSQTDFGVLTFTPDGSHPNLLYYQCWNHQNMGWKINIVDGLVDCDLTDLLPGDYDVTVTDANGCTGTNSFTVNPGTDAIEPVVTCPSNIVQCDNDIATFTATATDNCVASPVVDCVPPSGSSFAVGTTTVTCSATDNGNNTGSCSFSVTINESPVIAACPSDITQCGSGPATWTDPTASGSPSPTVACVPASGSSFNVGTTTVTCTATNSCGTSTCSFNVIVTATPACQNGGTVNLSCGCDCPSGYSGVLCEITNCVPPVIGACPSNIVQCDNNIATWTDPTSSGTSPVVTCSPASGSTFSTGTTTVTCTATNGCGTSSCSFSVTINESPVISACPSNIVQCDNHIATFSTPTATGTPAASVTCSPASGSNFSTGQTVVTCTAINSCGLSDCTFTVTINETPVISACPPNITQCNNHSVTYTAPTATGTPSASVQCFPTSGSSFPTGTSTVTCTATNSCGTSSCSFSVTINESPDIAACPGPYTQCDNHVVSFPTPPATGFPAATVVCSPASGSTFPTGMSTVTCTATNSCGNDFCAFSVTINETPQIGACPADIDLCNTNVATWTDPTSTPGYPAGTVSCSPPSGSTFPNGTTTVTCSASNPCGSTTCSFDVTVSNITCQNGGTVNQFCGCDCLPGYSGVYCEILNCVPPVIGACPSNIVQCDNFVATWTDPTATGTTPVVTCSPASGSTFSAGTTSVTCTATNGCGTSSCSFSVTINVSPVIGACPSNITQCDNHVVTYSTPSATGTPAASVVCSPASGSTFVTGTTTVTCTATNSCGTSSCSFSVTINETPVLSPCPSNIVQCDNNIATWSDPVATGSPAATVVCTPASGSTFSAGTTTVTCSATNSCGTDNCTFSVTINESPVIGACPSNITQCDNHVVTYSAPSATGTPAASVVCAPASGSTFNTGTTTVLCAATNSCGNSTCTFSVTINETPVLSPCPSNIVQCDNYVATWSDPIATGTPAAPVVCTPASGSTFSAGTTTVTCSATNSCGTDNCTFSVTINESPVIGACPSDITTANPVVTYATPSATGTPSPTVTCSPASGSTFPNGTTVVTCTAVNSCGTSTCTFNVNVTGGCIPSTDPTSATSNAAFGQICLGGNVTLTVNGGSLGTGASWQWYEGGCGTGGAIGNGASITITPGTNGAHVYYVRAEGTCGITNCVSVTVNVTSTPPSGTIHYTASITDGCVSAPAATFSTNTVSGAGFYRWTSAQSGVRFNGNPSPFETATPTVSVTFVSLPPGGSSGWSICVAAGNACGLSNTVCAWVRATVSMPAPIAGSVIGCPGSSGNNYSVAAVAGAVSYQWSGTAGMVITNNGSQNVQVSFPGGFTTGVLSVHAQTSCGYNGPDRNLTINSTPAIPGTITGTSYPCPNGTAAYSIAPVTGAVSYTWSTSVPGAIVTGTTTTCSIQFPGSIPAGSTVSVVANSSCPTSSGVRSKGISSGIPNVPVAINGPASGQCGQTGVSYSITPVALATSYAWSTSCGTIVGPNNLSAISVDWPGAFTTCMLSVSAVNACGTGGARTLVVSSVPATPPAISGTTTPCAGSVSAYSTAGSTGATSYTWTLPAGSVILGPTNGSSITVLWGSTSGNITVVASNSCGNSGTRSLSCVISCRMSQVATAGGFNAELYPNPATDKATVKFNASEAGNYSVILYDIIGNKMLSVDGAAVQGENLIELNLAAIAKGIYMLSVISNENSEQIRVVVE